MTRRRFLLGAGAMVAMVLIGIVVWRVGHPDEPIYEGKTLSQWIQGHLPNSSANPPFNSPGWHKANEAVRRIGVAGLPTLVGMIRAKDPPAFLQKIRKQAERLGLIRPSYRYAYQLNEEAAYAFEILGTNGAPAVPDLVRAYEDNLSRSSQRCAAQALGNIGRPAAAAAVPVLLKSFDHTNWEARWEAVTALYHTGGDPEILIPAFRRMVKDPNINVRWNAITALSNHGRRARAAVPELLEALHDTGSVGSSPIRKQVETALWYIAPEWVGKLTVVETNTSIVVNGKTVASLDVLYNGERRTLVRADESVPCARQFWDSAPVHPLSLYRYEPGSPPNDQFLGQFEVLDIPEPRLKANVAVLCIITEQQILMSARNNGPENFLEIRRVR